MQHRVQSDLENADMTSNVNAFKTPEGLLFGAGTTVGNSIEGWAPGAIFIDTNASSGGQRWTNEGTSTAASWVKTSSLVQTDRGTVTQLTSKSTGVTSNTLSGAITTHNASLAAAAEVTFTVTNTAVAATDVVAICVASGAATSSTYVVGVGAVAAGSFDVYIGNLSAGSLGEALVLNYVVIHTV